MKARCPRCDREFDLGDRKFARVGGALAGAALGGRATHRLGGALLGALAGGLLGRWIDHHLLPACPACEGTLEEVCPPAPVATL